MMIDARYEAPLWDRLKESGKPIFLYGTGNGGDKIISALEKHSVALSGVFASDGFVRSREFHSFHVRSYSDVREEYGDDIIILLAFGTTLPEVRAFIEELDVRHELYIPDVPLYGGELFDGGYFASHYDALMRARSLFADEYSTLLFDDMINFRLSGKMKYLSRTEEASATLHNLFDGKKISTVVDGGAYRGDSAEIFIDALSPDTVYAVEADPKTFKKLTAFADSSVGSAVIPINAALWNENGMLEYSSSGSRGAGESGQNRRAKCAQTASLTLDKLFSDYGITSDGRVLIKLDVEGAEKEAVDGGLGVISAFSPDMAVSLYHRTDDVITLTERIHSLLPHHRLYLRRISCIPMWDLTLYAVGD